MTEELEIRKEQLPAIEILEIELLKMDQVPCPVIHRFGPGIYIREVTVPAGTVAIGHYQKYEHMNVFLHGRVSMFNDDGSMTELCAPMIFVGKPGRKIGYVHEDMVWLNIYSTNERDVETLEKTFLDKSPAWEFMNKLRENQALKAIGDIEDYRKLLTEYRLSEETVRAQTENEDDQIPMPLGNYKIAMASSHIEGSGIFATCPIESGEIIAPARIDGKRTPVGRYVNHSRKPNAQMIEFNGDIYLVALTEINGCRAGFLGEEITTDYRSNLKLIGVKPCPESQ